MRGMTSGMFKGNKGGNASKQRGAGFKLLMALVVVYVIGMFAFMFGTMFSIFAEPFALAGLNWLYFALAGAMGFMLSFIGSVFMAQMQLFESKDNEMLLAMPVKPRDILLSRVTALLIFAFAYNFLVMVPAGVVWAMHSSISAVGVIIFIVSLFVLPLLSLAFSCFFGWLIALISSKMRNKNLITIIFSIAFFAVYMFAYSRIEDLMNYLVINGEQLAEVFRKVLFPFYHMGRAVAEANVTSILLMLATTILPFLIVLKILSVNFIKIATANKGMKRVKYKAAAMRATGYKTALFKKDLRHFISRPMYILNSCVGILLGVVMVVMLMGNKEMLNIMAADFGASVADSLMPAVMCLVLCVAAASNFVTAPSISLEAKTLWLVRSMPVRTGDIIMSKIYLHLAVTAPFSIVLSVVCGVMLKASVFQVLWMVLAPVCVNIFCAFMGIMINLRFPKFDWISETAAVKQSASGIVAMFAGWAVILIPTLLYILVLAPYVAVDAYIFLMMAVFLALSLVMYSRVHTSWSRKLDSLNP